MKLLDLIKSYVKDSIEEKTRYNTDFGIGVFTTINYIYWGEYPSISVKIRGGNSKSFNMNQVSENEVVDWIFNNIK